MMLHHNLYRKHCYSLWRKTVAKSRIDVKTNDELHDLIAAAAEKKCISMGEVMVQWAAAALGRPDLGWVPREPPGRKPGRRFPEPAAK